MDRFVDLSVPIIGSRQIIVDVIIHRIRTRAALPKRLFKARRCILIIRHAHVSQPLPSVNLTHILFIQGCRLEAGQRALIVHLLHQPQFPAKDYPPSQHRSR